MSTTSLPPSSLWSRARSDPDQYWRRRSRVRCRQSDAGEPPGAEAGASPQHLNGAHLGQDNQITSREDVMKETTLSFIDRFPQHQETITALSESNAQFKDLLGDYGDVTKRLSDTGPSDDPDRQIALEQRRKNLEQELVMLIQGYPLA